jgi:membrane fusion protein (multidrug efflux system)
VEVTLGRRRVGEVEVLGGLDEGARVVTEGTLRVKPGAAVTVVGAAGEDA